MIEGVNAVAASQFVALVIALVGCVALWRLVLSLLDRIDRQWVVIGTMADALKESNAIAESALDRLERQRA